MFASARSVLLASIVVSLAACGTNEAATSSDGSGLLLEDAGDAQGGGNLGDGDTTGEGGLSDAAGTDGGTTPVPEPSDAGPEDVAVPVETSCGNGVDDDFDGNVDCADSDCAADPVCAGLADSEFNCVDDIDNDGNGAVDCDDDACTRSPVCRETPIADAGTEPSDAGPTPPEDAGPEPPRDAGGPPVPDGGGGGGGFEWQCGDSVDNDEDGAVDCADNDCEFIPPCLGGGGGGGTPPIPFEFQCGDGIDNDADGSVDCDDDNCRFIPPCLGR